MKLNHSKIICQICGENRRAVLRRAGVVRPAISQLIEKQIESWDPNGWICVTDLQKFQYKFVHSLLLAEKGELTDLENEVLRSLEEHEILAHNPEAEFEGHLTIGQRLADHIAEFGGSWPFIMIFGVILIIWMFINTYILASKPFDPFPFILLNLVLSCLAAIQAPVIMMSQKRQESRDRNRAMHDYQVNLKAELEIRQLHQKVDHLLSHQWERLVEIQEIQMELIEEVRSQRRK